MTDTASQGQEESGYRGVKGEAAGMEGSASVKLIQCKMNKMKESTPRKTPQTLRSPTGCTKHSIKLKGAEKRQSVDGGSWIVII